MYRGLSANVNRQIALNLGEHKMNGYLVQKATLVLCVSMVVVAPSLMLTAPLIAQDTPIGTPGTQVGTQQTPAAATNTDELRKAAQNPVASLISVPVQDNFNFNIFPGDRTQNVLNIQPVIPARISKNWNLITRVITPIVYQPLPSAAGQITQQGVYGLGDMNPTFFLSPAKPGEVIWGAGPAMLDLPIPLRRKLCRMFAVEGISSLNVQAIVLEVAHFEPEVPQFSSLRAEP
jgi:hypothetical protein